MTIINEEKNYRELNESIRMEKGQKDKKKILIKLLNKVYKHNEIINTSLKH